MKHCNFSTAFLLTARRSRLTSVSSLLAAVLLTPAFASTPGFDTLVNYDTAWTYVYDGGKQTGGSSIDDYFYDVKSLSGGGSICVGQSNGLLFLLKLNSNGKVVWSKSFTVVQKCQGMRIIVGKDGDLYIAGSRSTHPWILKSDSLGNLKWSTWLYDSTKSKPSPLSRGATINSLQESSRGTIICAAGDQYPNNGGSALTNYAAYLEFDSLGKLINYTEWQAVTGLAIGGFSIAETKGENMLLGGNEAVFYLDSVGNAQWQTKYTFQLNGVGSVTNNVYRVKVLRDNTPLVMGQAYEGNCWTRYSKLNYDAWWSPIRYESGTNTAWDTAGVQGGDDYLYDFAQLTNGNLVFIGQYPPRGGIWVFVTDSMGKQMYWQKNFGIPYKNLDGNACRAYSVCAAPDGGFSVVGYNAYNDSNGAYNAVAAHFVPKPVSAVVSRSKSPVKSSYTLTIHNIGPRLIVGGNMPNLAKTEAALFDMSGRCVAAKTGNKEISFDISNFAKGTYIARLKTESTTQTMKMIYE